MATWLTRLAILAIAGFPLALVGYRLGLFDFSIALQAIAATFMLAVVVFFVALKSNFTQAKRDPRKVKAARLSLFLCLLVIIALGNQLIVARSVPEIHNISTDVVNPPEFDKIAEIRTPQHNALAYDIKALAVIQKKAYPQVKTLLLDNIDKSTAQARAVAVVKKLGWQLVAENPTTGIIEATDTSLLWNFKDDIVIRITAKHPNSIAIDLRSVSRIGRSDLGKNAQRIKRFLDEYINHL